MKDIRDYVWDTQRKTTSEIDPKLVEAISAILGRDISKEITKPRRSYNTSVISQSVDAGLVYLMEVGLEKTQPLDLVKILNDQLRFQGRVEYENLRKAINSKSYKDAPFTKMIEADIRASFILQTEEEDTFESLFKELEDNILYYMDEDQWRYVKKSILLSRERVLNEDVIFPDPAPKCSTGVLRVPTIEEKTLMELPVDCDFKIDQRKDSDDLLALKEMVALLKGKKAHPLTIGPGFFLKYLPEMVDQTSDADAFSWRHQRDRNAMANRAKEYQKDMSQQWDGIAFKFNKDNELVKIKLYKLPYVHSDHGTVLASLGLIYSQAYINVDKQYEIKINSSNRPILLERYKADKAENYEDLFKNGERYMILTNAYVSAPENNSPLGYSKISKNNRILRAGECYLFEEVDNQVLNTRLYFYPYQPSKVNPMLQHGSVIFGSNDQSFHTCSSPNSHTVSRDDKSLDPEYRDLLMDYWKELGNEYSFDSNTLAGKLSEIVNPDGTPSNKVLPPELFKPIYEKILLKIIQGTYDFSPLAMYFANLHVIDQVGSPYYFKDRDLIFKMQKHAFPL